MRSRNFTATLAAFLVPAAIFAADPVPASEISDEDAKVVNRELSADTRDGIIVNVNGQIVTIGDLRRETTRYIPEVRRSSNSQQEFQEKIRQLMSSTLQSLADNYLLVSAFDDFGGMIDDNYIDQRINDIIEQDFEGDRSKYLQMLRRTGSNPLADKRRIKERIKAASWDEQMVRRALGEISPAKVKAEYEARIEEFKSDEAVEYAQLVLFAGASETDEQVEQLANRLRKQIKNGETEFEETAKVFSRDDYRSAGGYVGWKPFTDLSEQIVPELKKINDGEVSDVITLDAPNGKIFVLLKRIAYREAGVIPLKDVRRQIEHQLRSRRVQELRAQKMAELRDEYYIRQY